MLYILQLPENLSHGKPLVPPTKYYELISPVLLLYVLAGIEIQLNVLYAYNRLCKTI